MDLYPSPFSPAQIAWLERYLDHRLRPQEDDPPSSADARRYLSLSAIRTTLIANSDELYDRLGEGRPFPISVLRHLLESWVELGAGDREITPGATVERWESQLRRSIDPKLWTASPFEKADRRGHWSLKRRSSPNGVSASQTALAV